MCIIKIDTPVGKHVVAVILLDAAARRLQTHRVTGVTYRSNERTNELHGVVISDREKKRSSLTKLIPFFCGNNNRWTTQAHCMYIHLSAKQRQQQRYSPSSSTFQTLSHTMLKQKTNNAVPRSWQWTLTNCTLWFRLYTSSNTKYTLHQWCTQCFPQKWNKSLQSQWPFTLKIQIFCKNDPKKRSKIAILR